MIDGLRRIISYLLDNTWSKEYHKIDDKFFDFIYTIYENYPVHINNIDEHGQPINFYAFIYTEKFNSHAIACEYEDGYIHRGLSYTKAKKYIDKIDY